MFDGDPKTVAQAPLELELANVFEPRAWAQQTVPTLLIFRPAN
jgi:hypothetical protein